MTDDQLVAAYLRRLRRAARGLPRARRNELLDEIANHVAQARAAGAAPLRDVLGGLGDPEEIAAAAGPVRGARLGGVEAAAIALLLFGGFIFLVGWFAGLILLWISPRWRWPDKLLGTLVWPGGYAAVLLLGMLGASGAGEVCTGRAGRAGRLHRHRWHAGLAGGPAAGGHGPGTGCYGDPARIQRTADGRRRRAAAPGAHARLRVAGEVNTTDLPVHTMADLDAVAAGLSSRPRKTLGWVCPAERLAQLLETCCDHW